MGRTSSKPPSMRFAAQDNEVDRDTVEWRSQFMKNNPSWTAKDVADQSTSTAKNRAALASRWAQEGKIFAVKYEGQLWYPRFQCFRMESL